MKVSWCLSLAVRHFWRLGVIHTSMVIITIQLSLNRILNVSKIIHISPRGKGGIWNADLLHIL